MVGVGTITPSKLLARAPFDIQYTTGPKQSFDEMFYAKNVGHRYRGANKRRKLNTLVFPNTPGTADSPLSFRGNKKSMFISLGARFEC